MTTKILYIGGYLRIGSTLLDRCLGQVEGLFSAGELRRVWEESFAADQPCGCGEPFSRCEFWREVISRAYAGFDHVEVEANVALKHRVDRMRHIPALLAGPRGTYADAYREYAGRLSALYGAIREVSGARVIIDSSKDPSYAYVLANLPDTELYAVHLVRDSRAVAHSWLRKKVKHTAADGSEVYMPLIGPRASSVGWSRANVLFEPIRLRAAGYLRLRYEDFLASPEATVERIMGMLGEEATHPFTGDREIELAPGHTVAGNPMRFMTGHLQLRLDGEWQGSLEPSHRRTVTAMTWPLLYRYGYLGHGRVA